MLILGVKMQRRSVPDGRGCREVECDADTLGLSWSPPGGRLRDFFPRLPFPLSSKFGKDQRRGVPPRKMAMMIAPVIGSVPPRWAASRCPNEASERITSLVHDEVSTLCLDACINYRKLC